MRDNERLLAALKKAVENKPDIELGKFIRYITSVSDLTYMSDEDISVLVEDYNSEAKEEMDAGVEHGLRMYEHSATEINYLGDFCTESEKIERMYDFTKENEQIAYERYKAETENRIFCPQEERLDGSDFLKRFELLFADANDFKNITVINHRDNFLNVFPDAYRHMNAYVVGKKGDKYIAKHAYAGKNTCFGELLGNITFGFCREFDECFSVAIDWMESPRFTDYTKRIMYGVYTRPEKDEIEIYDNNQSIEIFHELMQKSNQIVSDWDGVIYDDGTI